MSIYKCKFCETAVKSMKKLKRHIAEVHPKESGEVEQYLGVVDAKLQSLSEVLVTENSSGDQESDSKESTTTPENHRVDFSIGPTPNLSNL